MNTTPTFPGSEITIRRFALFAGLVAMMSLFTGCGGMERRDDRRDYRDDRRDVRQDNRDARQDARRGTD